MPHRKAGIPPEIRPGGAQDGIAVQGIRKARPAREQLREHRCKRRPAVMPAAAHDERKVQPHVQNGGGDEEIERRARIAHGAKEPRDDVVKDGRADPAEDDEQVPVGVIVIGGGRLHEAQKGRRERHRHRRDDDCDRNAQQIAHADRAAHARLVARAERLRDLDGKARSEPVDKAEHEEGAVSPTPVNAAAPTVFPTMMVSAMLYSCWKTHPINTGSAKKSMSLNGLPLVRSFINIPACRGSLRDCMILYAVRRKMQAFCPAFRRLFQDFSVPPAPQRRTSASNAARYASVSPPRRSRTSAISFSSASASAIPVAAP